MMGNLSLLCNFVEKYLGTVRFGNDQFALILGYGDLVQGNIMINRVYYVEGKRLTNDNLGMISLQFLFKNNIFNLSVIMLDMMKEKGDPAFWWDYSTQSKGLLVSTTSEQGLVPQRQKASDYDNPNPAPELQNVSPSEIHSSITIRSWNSFRVLWYG
ncbi:hypothetical protein Tco_1291708 [Tanacetum coccineum]